jgi:hypothetical protein
VRHVDPAPGVDYPRRVRAIRGALAGAVIALTPFTAVASAQTFEVTRHNDPAPGACKPNDCSLREAIRAANSHPGPDVVVLADRKPGYKLARENSLPGLDEDASARGDLDLTGKLTIRHPGRGMASVDGNAVDRVFEVRGNARLKRIRVTGGGNVSEDVPRSAARRTSTAGSGGGFEVHGSLTLERSAVVRNTGAATGGGINAEFDSVPDPPVPSVHLVRSVVAHNETIEGTGGGVEVDNGRLRVDRSRVIGNRAANAGGGIEIGYGGTLRMDRSTVSRNFSPTGPEGVYLFESSARISNSTISDGRGATTGSGGGVEVSQSTLTMVNSTVSGNTTNFDGAGLNAGSSSTVNLRSVTVVRNVADADDDNTGAGGGLFQENGGVVNVVNSLIALNREGNLVADCSGEFQSGGGNLLTSLGCTGFEIGSGDFLNAVPKIGNLARNGGPTETVALKKGSPAIGKAVKSESPKRDQRGHRRDAHPDIGAFER